MPRPPSEPDRAEQSAAPSVALDTLTDAFVTVGADWRIGYLNRRTASDGAPDEALVGAEFWAAFPGFVDTRVEERCRAAMSERTPVWFAARIGERSEWFEVRAYPSDDGLAVDVQDVTEQRRRQVRLRERTSELETLNRVNEVAREVNRALVGVGTDEEVTRTVCDRIAASDLYRMAAFVRHSTDGASFAPVAVAGADEDYLTCVATLDDGEVRASPVGQALETGKIRTVDRIADEPTLPDTAREAALARGYRSVAAVPVVYGPNVYGVLLVYTDRPDAFDGRERAVFAELGETVGDALNAVNARRLLFTDTVVELELAVSDPTAFATAAVSTTGATLRLRRVIPVAEDRYHHYLTFEGVPTDDLLAAVEEDPAVCDARSIGDGRLLEVTTTADSAAARLVAAGARIRSGVVEGDEARLTAEVAVDADVRAVVESVDAVASGVQLVTKRAVNRPLSTAEEFRETLSTELSNRQRVALEMAYVSGYYEWPRDCTGEDLAEAMGVTPPTFHQHLRAAEQKLLRAFLDDPDKR